MGKSLKDKLNELPAKRRDRILTEADRLHAEYLTLQELRKAKQLTQAQLAEVLHIRQATIAQMEKRSDLMLSTVRSYVEAMGGKLSLMVEFPDHTPVTLEGLGDTEEPRRKRANERMSSAP
nr:XRE family transcriptional regulator [Marinicella sp. W31]MDC2878240.1 XRE family transcriptional regulator [Marinicella sp. W31]